MLHVSEISASKERILQQRLLSFLFKSIFRVGRLGVPGVVDFFYSYGNRNIQKMKRLVHWGNVYGKLDGAIDSVERV